MASMRPIVYVVAGLALVAVVVIGLGQAGDSGSEPTSAPSFDLDGARAQLEGAPGPLASLHEQSNRLLDGGKAAFDDRLTDLEGHPAVINKWASWCGPCRAEFPIFQQVATDRGKELAFLGVNARDARPAAEDFLAERPLPYPSYEDEEEKISRELRAAQFFPMTVFVDRRGEIAFVKAGEYTTEAELEADIDRYLGA
jgi:cytochrome c biogenesis protein CcmG, thiol:disulfide interchange protein DsbE